MKAKVNCEVIINAVANLDNIVKEKDVVLHHTQFYLNNGFLHATDGRMIVGCPINLKPKMGVFIPGKQFVRIINNMPLVDKPVAMELTDDYTTLIIKVANFKAKIKVEVEGDLKVYTPISYNRTLCMDDKLIDRLYAVRPFISDNATRPWALGAYINDGKIFATNNVSLVETKINKGWSGLLPYWAIDFILGQTAELKGFFTTDKVAAFYWKDNTWMQAKLLVGEFPKSAIEMLNKTIGKKLTHKLSEEWKATYFRIAALSEEKISIYKDKIFTGDESNYAEEEIKTSLPKDIQMTLWNEKFLSKVITVATSWSPQTKTPTPFIGDNIRGMMVGLRIDTST